MSSSLWATDEGLVWLIGAVVCLLAANRGSSCSLTRAMDGRIVRCGIISRVTRPRRVGWCHQHRIQYKRQNHPIPHRGKSWWWGLCTDDPDDF